MKDTICADCGGFDIEWMRKCPTHGLEYCRGCECPECEDEFVGEDYDDCDPDRLPNGDRL